MSQKGFIPIVVAVCVLAAAAIGGGAIYIANRDTSSPAQPSESEDVVLETVIPASQSASLTPSIKPAVKPSNKPSVLPSPKPSQTPTASSQPQTSSTPQPSASGSSSNTSNPPSQTTSKVTCEVHFNPNGGAAPIDVKLIYAASYSGSNNYVTNVQWDWDGDGNWDTDFSPNNQHTTHTYSAAGKYNVKLKVQTLQGDISDVCSKEITIN